MPQRIFMDAGAQSTAPSAITNAQTSVTLQSASGFSAPVSGQQFSVVILDSGNPAYNAASPLSTPYEYQQVNNVSGNVLTFGPGGGSASRVAYAGTTPKAFFAGATVAQTMLAEDIQASFPIKFDDQSPSGVSSQSITVPAGFKAVQLRMRILNSASFSEIGIRFNNDSGSSYIWQETVAGGGTSFSASGSGATYIRVSGLAASGQACQVTVEINGANSSLIKTLTATAARWDASATVYSSVNGGAWNNGAAITSIQVVLSAGLFGAGTNIEAYAYP